MTSGAVSTLVRSSHNVEATPCERRGPGLWFSQAPADLELAKTLCRDCPLLRPCLAGACQRREPHGVWGGEIFEQGVVISQKRPRGRPRKQAKECKVPATTVNIGFADAEGSHE